jgi:hypothetical protein
LVLPHKPAHHLPLHQLRRTRQSVQQGIPNALLGTSEKSQARQNAWLFLFSPHPHLHKKEACHQNVAPKQRKPGVFPVFCQISRTWSSFFTSLLVE